MVQYILVRQTVTYKEALKAEMKYEGVSTTLSCPQTIKKQQLLSLRDFMCQTASLLRELGIYAELQ